MTAGTSDAPTWARLLCRTGEFAGMTADVRDEISVGRGTDNGLIIDSLLLSREHARIYREDGTWWVEDLDSRNGTRVDGTEVSEPTPLERLSVISFADAVDFVFVQAPSAAAASSEAEAPPPSADRAPSAPEEPARTRLDMAGFGAVPDLEGDGGDEGESDAGDDGPTKAPAGEPGGTRLDMSGFGAMPDLGAEEAETAEEPEETDEPEAEPAGSAEVPGGEPGGTRLDMSGFGAMPDLGTEEAESAEEPDEAEQPGEPGEGDAEPAGPTEDEEPSPAEPERDAPEPGGTRLDMGGFGSLPDLDDPESEPEPSEEEPEGGAVQLGLLVEIDGAPKAFELEPGENVVGRAGVCDIVLPDTEKVLSRRHAVVRLDEDGVTLVDLDSANGVWIGEERVEQTSLEPGDTFKLGPFLQITLIEI